MGGLAVFGSAWHRFWCTDSCGIRAHGGASAAEIPRQSHRRARRLRWRCANGILAHWSVHVFLAGLRGHLHHRCSQDRKSTRLNSSHVAISYAVFCLKKKKEEMNYTDSVQK